MSIEEQAKKIAERIGWPDQYNGRIRHAGVSDMARAMVVFNNEQTKNLQAEIERLRAAAEFARCSIDKALGDSDLDGDDDPLFLACQKLSSALNR